MNLSHLVDCLNRVCHSRSECVPKSLHEDVRVERDATLFALKFALETVDEQREEIEALKSALKEPL